MRSPFPRRCLYFLSRSFLLHCFLVLLLTSATQPCSADKAAESQLKQKELEVLKDRISGLQKELAEKQSDKSRIEREMEVMDMAIASIAKKVYQTQQEINAMSKQISDLDTQFKSMNASLVEQR